MREEDEVYYDFYYEEPPRSWWSILWQMVKVFLRLPFMLLGALVKALVWLIPKVNWQALGNLMRRSLKEAFWFLADVLGTLLERTLPEAEERPSSRLRSARRAMRRARPDITGDPKLIALGLMIPLMVGVLGGYTFWQVRAWQGRRFEHLVEQAAEKEALARTGKSEAGKTLRQARRLLDGALRLRPEHREALALREKVQAQLDELNKVERLYWLPLLRTLPGGPSFEGRVVVHGPYVFVLDREADKVYGYLLDEMGDKLKDPKTDILLTSKGAPRGDAAVGDLIDITWAGKSLFILDGGGAWLRYDPPAGLTVLPIKGLESWQWPWRIAGYGDTLYLLDPPANRVLKYSPTVTSYHLPPTDYLAPQTIVDLREAQDIAIDGCIYVLLKDGIILKFWQGLRIPFEVRGIDQPLRAPKAIYTSRETSSVYVADAGNRRIVQLDKDGRYQHQILPQEGDGVFDDLKSIYVDEVRNKLYILSGNKLYMAALPQEGTQ